MPSGEPFGVLITSALLAVLFDEPDADYFERVIASATTYRMSIETV